jgi:hypothetical protein
MAESPRRSICATSEVCGAAAGLIATSMASALVRYFISAADRNYLRNFLLFDNTTLRPQHPLVGKIEASLRKSFLFVFACCAAAQQQPVFHSQTRMVEVDVVVRDKHGQVTGLTKDDFTLYACKVHERDLNHAGSKIAGNRP